MEEHGDGRDVLPVESYEARLVAALQRLFPQYGAPVFTDETGGAVTLHILGVPLTFAAGAGTGDMPLDASAPATAREGAALLGLRVVEALGETFLKADDGPLRPYSDAILARLQAHTAADDLEAVAQEHERRAEAAGHGRVQCQVTHERGALGACGPLVRALARGLAIERSAPSKSAPSEPPAKALRAAEGAPAAARDTGRSENAVCALYAYHTRSGAPTPPAFDFVTRRAYHGCVATYAGARAVVPAVYKRKADAKMEGARRLCVRLLGDIASFPFVPPDDPECGYRGEDGEDAAVSGAPQGQPGAPDATAGLPGLPAGPIADVAPEGRRFVSIVNEYCLKRRMAAPEYAPLVVPPSMVAANATAYVFRVADFAGAAFTSYIFARKADAKEDCAARIALHLRERGLVTAAFHALAPETAPGRPLHAPMPPPGFFPPGTVPGMYHPAGMPFVAMPPGAPFPGYPPYAIPPHVLPPGFYAPGPDSARPDDAPPADPRRR